MGEDADMNPGVTDSAERVATSLLDSMKSQPLALGLLICNMMLLVLFFYIAKVATENRRFEFTTLQDSQKEIHQMLYNCTPNPKLVASQRRRHSWLRC